MIDIVREIEAVEREVGEGVIPAGASRIVRLRRVYSAPIDDVWDALTNPERIGRWFLPISGDYRLGGRYQFEGNAGGEIVACERPSRLRVTWGMAEMGDTAEPSQVEVRLSAVGDETTRLELEHTAAVPEEMWAEYGPGAVGVGWEGGLLGLTLHLRGGSGVGDPTAWQMSDEGRAFSRRSSEGWGAASRAAGVDPETVARNVASTSAFYAPEPGASPAEA
jgi:uncharacterized protein YndB with AHSA1/START domain